MVGLRPRASDVVTASEHYRESERLLVLAASHMGDSFADDLVIAAQAHATLALVATLALAVKPQ